MTLLLLFRGGTPSNNVAIVVTLGVGSSASAASRQEPSVLAAIGTTSSPVINAQMNRDTQGVSPAGSIISSISGVSIPINPVATTSTTVQGNFTPSINFAIVATATNGVNVTSNTNVNRSIVGQFGAGVTNFGAILGNRALTPVSPASGTPVIIIVPTRNISATSTFSPIPTGNISRSNAITPRSTFGVSVLVLSRSFKLWRWNGTQWVRTSFKEWNGSSWVTSTRVKAYDNATGTWVTVQ